MIKDMVKGVIFDMDGTVIDSTKNDYHAWEKAFKEHGVEFPYETFLDMLGAKGSEIVSSFIKLKEDEIELFLQKKESYFKDFVEKDVINPIEGVVDLIKELNNRKMSMALDT